MAQRTILHILRYTITENNVKFYIGITESLCCVAEISTTSIKIIKTEKNRQESI